MSEPLTVLHHLMETLTDGQEGFRSASDDVESEELKALLLQHSLQRGTFASELQELAEALGESEPPDGGSITGALHRGWMDIKSAITHRDDHVILAECERGEQHAISAYRKALNDPDLPADVADTLRTQAIEITTVHDQLCKLRSALAPRH